VVRQDPAGLAAQPGGRLVGRQPSRAAPPLPVVARARGA